jgi:excisionase family DNA binding protein
MVNAMEERLLLVAEVADRLRCSVSTVYALLETGRLVGHRCPGWRVKADDLQAYIEGTKKEPQLRPERSRGPLPQLRHIKL